MVIELIPAEDAVVGDVVLPALQNSSPLPKPVATIGTIENDDSGWIYGLDEDTNTLFYYRANENYFIIVARPGA